MNFENYNDYLLSLNIAQISREFGFKKVGMNSLYLITNIIKSYVENLAVKSKESTELSGRLEVNLIDVFFNLIDLNITQESLLLYLKESKIQYKFSKNNYIGRIYSAEEKERNTLIQKINSTNVLHSTAIPQNIINAIPKPLRFFPRDFALKETENITELNEDVKKTKNDVKRLEKKSLEEIISSNNYYDLSKKHSRQKNAIDITHIFKDIIKTEELSLGKKFKMIQRDKKEDFGSISGIINENANIANNDIMDKHNFDKGDLMDPKVNNDDDEMK